jgi:hypothetical protein
MRALLSVCAAAGLAATLGGGCARAVTHSAEKSPLATPRMSPDSVELEIFFVRSAPDDPQANDALWTEVDEQVLPADLRRALAENGFRVGVIGAQMPAAMQRMLDLEGRAPTADEECLVNVDQDARVCRRRLQVRSGRRSEIVASAVYDELPMLLREGEHVTGRTLEKAQGVLSVKTFPGADGRVRLELAPELHYGEPRQQFRGGEEMFYLETGRPREVLDQLQLAASLSPGQALMLASLPDRAGSLGRRFFTEQAGGELVQKLLLIRLVGTQDADQFAPESELAASGN